jgi:hypothetical protein
MPPHPPGQRWEQRAPRHRLPSPRLRQVCLYHGCGIPRQSIPHNRPHPTAYRPQRRQVTHPPHVTRPPPRAVRTGPKVEPHFSRARARLAARMPVPGRMAAKAPRGALAASTINQCPAHGDGACRTTAGPIGVVAVRRCGGAANAPHRPERSCVATPAPTAPRPFVWAHATVMSSR